MQKIINYLHLVLLIFLISSPFINECGLKINAFILINFIILHFITKYGKCGIINIERFLIGDDFKNGFFYRLIKPVISYKNNIFYDKLFNMMILYSIILFIQIYQANCFWIIYNEFIILYKKFIK